MLMNLGWDFARSFPHGSGCSTRIPGRSRQRQVCVSVRWVLVKQCFSCSWRGLFLEENVSKRLERLLSDLWSKHVGYSRERHVSSPAAQPAHASRPAAAACKAATGISPAAAPVLSQ